jgi:hypothetical protein
MSEEQSAGVHFENTIPCKNPHYLCPFCSIINDHQSKRIILTN